MGLQRLIQLSTIFNGSTMLSNETHLRSMRHLTHLRLNGYTQLGTTANIARTEGIMIVAQQQELISVRDAARQLGVSDDTVRRMINDGSLRAVKVRFQWRVYADSVRDYLERQQSRDEKE
jgi:excisionase family DNA binding protein